MHRLYLHIGTHKTGTTSIQRFLASNRTALRKQGLLYPDNTLGGFPRHYAHHRIAHAMADKPGQGTADDASRFFDALRDQLGRGEAAVISAEPMYRHVVPRAKDASARLYNGGGRLKGDPLGYIRTVRDCIGDFDVTVMVMLRRQDSFIESLYAEEVMTSSYTAGIGPFIDLRGWLADYDERLAMWSEVFGPGSLSVRIFEPATFGMPIERYFLEWIGGAWDNRFVPAAIHNVTVPRALVEYKRAINDNQPRALSAKYRKWLERLAANAPDGALPSIGRNYLTHDARVEIMERFESGNRRLAETYFGREELFSPSNATAQYTDPSELGNEDFRKITQMLLRSLAN